MKKTVSVSIESINSSELKKVQEVRAAIRTLKEFALQMRNTARPGGIAKLEAKATPEPETEKKTPAFAYFFVEVDTDELEHDIKQISEATDDLETAIKGLEETIFMGITKQMPQE